MIVGILVGSFSGLTFPAMQQLMTERIAEDAQGELQGTIASIVSITSIFGPLAMTMLIGAYADPKGVYLSGAPFLLAALLLMAAIALLRASLRRVG